MYIPPMVPALVVACGVGLAAGLATLAVEVVLRVFGVAEEP